MVLTEVAVLERIMKNVQRSGNGSVESRRMAVELLLWRHCQSLSQGKCYESSIDRNDRTKESLRCSFDHKNFKSFRHFISKFHDKFGFDIVSLLLHRTVSAVYVPVLVQSLVERHNHDHSVLHRYRSIVMGHFEQFTDGILSAADSNAECARYFGSLCSVEQPWLFAVVFVLEAMTATDDEIWITCFQFMMDELGDIMTEIEGLDSGLVIEDEKARNELRIMLDGLWAKVKRTKYMEKGHVLQRLNLAVCHQVLT